MPHWITLRTAPVTATRALGIYCSSSSRSPSRMATKGGVRLGLELDSAKARKEIEEGIRIRGATGGGGGKSNPIQSKSPSPRGAHSAAQRWRRFCKGFGPVKEGFESGDAPPPMRKFQDSVKALEADIEHANALASEFLRDYDGSVIQMRMAYSAVAHFLLQWTDCKLAGALGLLKIMIYKVYTADGTTALPDWEREASIREFYGVIFPSLLQLPSGITELDDKKQRRLCVDKFRGRNGGFSQVDLERELECGICLEVNAKIVLPDCAHSLCMRCFEDWNAKSKSCPFCRTCLEKVEPNSLWMYTDDRDVVDMDALTRENIRRLFMYINKLPLVVLHVVDLDIYEYRIK